MKRVLLFPLMLYALLTLQCMGIQAETVWKKGDALLTKGSQITSNNTENGFPPSNLLRPESDGVGTNQYIWHSSWNNPGPLPAGTDTYLQVHLNEAEQHIIFTMIGSTWNATYDTPTEMVIEAADLPSGEWTEVAHLTDMQDDFTGWTPDRYESPHIDLGAAHTYIRFIVKKTVNAGKSSRYDANGNPFVSLGRFQVYRAVEGEPDPIDPKENINLLFIGNSITAGATLSNASVQAPPIVCRSLIQEATGVTTNVYNGGHSGITTFGYLPGRDDFTRIVNNAKAFKKANGGHIYISIMLGTNDSACSGTEGAPVAPDTYRDNIKTIIDKLIASVPDCRIILNYPIWYSPSTYNGAKYLQEGLDRLHSYYPILDGIVAEYDQVYPGNRDVWEYFENNFALFTRESGNAGYFYLHPNANGATRLAEIWAKSLLQLIEADGIEVKPLPEWNTFKPQNDKKYSMKTSRGSMGTKNGKMTSTVKTGIGASKGEFAFISHEGKTYLYSISDKSFMYRDPVSFQDDWSNIICSNEYLQPIKVNYTGTPEAYPYYLTMDGYVFNSAASTQTGICANTYTPHDAGNQTAITEEGYFDPTEALEILANYVEKQPTVYEQILPTGATLKVFCAQEEKANGKAVIIIPGGGYSYVAGGYEGSDWAPFYLDLGFSVAVLTYNLPHGNPEVPLDDGRAALQYLRDKAEDLMIEPNLIGVMGFSAGGHLASTIATHLTGAELPAFQVLFYPVISMDSRYTHAGSRQNLLGDNPSSDLVNLYSNELQVTSETPPAYLCWASDDSTVKPTNSLKYKSALSKAGVPVTAKTFSSGGHGFGFNTSFAYHNQMLKFLGDWLKGLDGIITGIRRIDNRQQATDDGLFYNLAGQRVGAHYKGLIVSKDKKRLVK